MRPGRRLLYLSWLWLLAGLGAAAWERLLPAWMGLGTGLGLIAVADLLMVGRAPGLTVTRQVAGTLPLGVWSPVQLRVINPTNADIRLQVFDHYPTTADLTGLPWEGVVPAGGWAEVEYRLRPERRGDHAFAPADLLLHSRAGLWERRQRAGAHQPVRVLPDFRSVAGYALLAIEDRLGQMGIRLQQRRGEGLEFHQLREYRLGDSLRQVDWKATSRRRQLISKEYQDEKNQQVVLLIDCGRRMHARDGELSHFDHVLNTVLLLTHVALRQGDAVGLLTFGGHKRWVPPLKGRAAMRTVLEATYDLETSAEPPDYVEAAEHLMTRQRRRALVVVLSNLRDEDTEEIVPAFQLLRSRNLVLLASLRESILEKTLDRPLDTFRHALLTAATHHYLRARRRAHDRIKAGGILTLDVEPPELPIRLVNRYLEIKRSGLL